MSSLLAFQTILTTTECFNIMNTEASINDVEQKA